MINTNLAELPRKTYLHNPIEHHSGPCNCFCNYVTLILWCYHLSDKEDRNESSATTLFM